MKTINCARCSGAFPAGTMLSIEDQPFCAECGPADIEKRKQEGLPDVPVGRIIDPTVCARCRKDNGELVLGLVAGAPVCRECEEALRNYPYPGWVKAAFVVLVAIAVASFIHNWRFLRAHLEARSGARAAREGMLDEAAELFSQAAGRVPEARELAHVATVYRGLQLLSADRCDEAAALFREAQKDAPPNAPLGSLLLQAEAAAAFNRKDYDGFLEKAQAHLRLAPGDPSVIGQVASAYACKYAVTGQEEFKREAARYLEQARQATKAGDPFFEEYQERIRHRLDSREILSKHEYDRRFRRKSEKQED